MHLLNRRQFLRKSFLTSAGMAIGSLLNVPGALRNAFASDLPYAWNGNKILFIFLRGGNDGLNSLIPSGDPAYSPAMRPTLHIAPPDAGLTSGGQADPDPQPNRAIDLGNGFATLHPSLKALVPLYNDGELALIHRVGYPEQSRSHFDSERYWETGVPRDDLRSEGIFHRTLVETGLHRTQVMPAVSLQNTMPLILRGDVPMANINDPSRFDLLGVYAAARQKHIESITRMHGHPYPAKNNRDLLFPSGERFVRSVQQVQAIDFDANGRTGAGAKISGSPFLDDDLNATHLFPIDSASDENSIGNWSFFRSLKYSAQILGETDAVVAGTELHGFDTHSSQLSSHARLMTRVGWAMYALKKYLSHPSVNMWHKTMVVTLSEFGRTSEENGSDGTDHAEAGVMFVAGGAANFNGGVHQCDGASWQTGPSGSMFQTGDRYLARSVDYRSVFGEMLKRHLGIPEATLGRIIPGYANPLEHLLAGGTSMDGTPITGELGLFT